MQRAYRGNELATSMRLRAQGLRSRAKELERMLDVGAFDAKIRQRESEIQALRQRKSLLENELERLRRTLNDIAE